MVLLGRLIRIVNTSFLRYITIVIILGSVNTASGLEDGYAETSKLNLKFVDKLVHSPDDFFDIIDNSLKEFNIIVDSTLVFAKSSFLYSMNKDFSKINFKYAGTCIFKKYNKQTNDSVIVQKILYEEEYEFNEEVKDWWSFWYAGCDLNFCCHDNYFDMDFIWKNNSWHLHYYVLYQCVNSYLVLDIGNTNVP
jgi:hypothetical protein